jgi:hypothetical protein
MPSKKTTAEIVAIALREMGQWPSSWMGDNEDLIAGRALLPLMRSFVEDFATTKPSPRAAKKHVDNLWRLGGELVRGLHVDPKRRQDPVAYLMKTLSVEESPLLHGAADERAQESLDTTCRCFWRYVQGAGVQGAGVLTSRQR